MPAMTTSAPQKELPTSLANDDTLINAFTKVQEAMTYANIDGRLPKLPKIAVIGEQSVGKSSVLESIVGFRFLPKGLGTVTRRPTMIELKTWKESEENIAILRDPASGPGVNEQNFFTQDDIKNNKLTAAIIKATDNHVEKNDVSAEPIFVELRGPSLMDLTLVDLPGVVAEPENMKKRVEKMVEDEISDEETLILVVHPAGVDKQNDMALEIAKATDPTFKRTYGVLTKTDIMSEHTEGKMMQYSQYGLLTGQASGDNTSSPADSSQIKWIPVKNVDVYDSANARISLQEQRRQEEAFFESLKNTFANELGIEFAPPGYGIRYLCATLQSELSNRVKSYLRRTKMSLKSACAEMKENLEEMEQLSDEGVFSREAHKFLISFWTTFEKQIHGYDLTQDFQEIALGAKINDIFTGKFEDDMYAIDPLGDISDDDTARAIKNSKGVQNSLYLPMTTFQLLLRHTLEKHVLGICDVLVQDVFEQLLHHARHLSNSTGKANTRKTLRNWVYKRTEEVLDEMKKDCEKFVKNTVLLERRINSEHPDFPPEAGLKDIINTEAGEMTSSRPGSATTKSKVPSSSPTTKSQVTPISPTTKSKAPPTNSSKMPLVDLCLYVGGERNKECKASLMEDDSKYYVYFTGENVTPFTIPIERIKLFQRAVEFSDLVPLFQVQDGAVNQQYWCDASNREEYVSLIGALIRRIKKSESWQQESGIEDGESKPRQNSQNNSQNGASQQENGIEDGKSKPRQNNPKKSQNGDRRKKNRAREVKLTKELYKQYFDKIVRIKILDSVPKAVALLVVNGIDEEHILQSRLLDLFENAKKQEGGVREMMEWTEEDEQEKEKLKIAHAALTEALDALEL